MSFSFVYLRARLTCLAQGYQVTNWQQFLIYIGFTLIAFLLNAFMNSVLPRIYKGALFWSLGGFAVVSITVLACASPNYSSGKFVFTEFINQTGWPDGVAWLLGVSGLEDGRPGHLICDID